MLEIVVKSLFPMATSVPVVATASKVTLADHLDLRNMPLATTPAGKAYALKTLHPADHEIKSIRSPGGVVPSVGVTTDMLATIDFPPTSSYARIYQSPNIYCPCSLIFCNDADEVVEYWSFFNSAIGGPGLVRKAAGESWITGDIDWLGTLVPKFEKYKVLAQSVTCDLIAPAIADQGTIVSAQYVESRRTISPSMIDLTDTNTIKGVWNVCDCWYYGNAPPVSSMLMGTSAYSAKAKDGFYQPLKITGHKWRDIADNYLPMQTGDAHIDDAAKVYEWRLGNYPIFTGESRWAQTLPAFPKPQCDVVGVTDIRGVNVTQNISLRIRFRQCTEYIPKIGGIYASLAEAPFPPDDHANKMIVEIFGRMRDAYPASYNSTGYLKDIIHKLGNAVVKYVDPALTVLSAIPGVSSFAGPLKAAISTGKVIANALNPGKFAADLPRPARPPPPKADLVAAVTKQTKKKKSKSGKSKSKK